MRNQAILTIYALVGWAVCGATIGVGRQVVNMDVTLLIHAVVSPVAFGSLSWLYFKRFPASSALATALSMLGVVMVMDALVVAPLIEHSYSMFTSILGTWVPFVLIFIASYIVGRLVPSK